MSWFRRKKEEPQEPCEMQDVQPERGGFFSTHQFDSSRNRKDSAIKLRMAIEQTVKAVVDRCPQPDATSAMDAADSDNPSLLKVGSLLSNFGISDMLFAWYASQSFIGHQACAFLAQNWLIDKACTVPARDAVRNWFEITSAEGESLDTEQLKQIERLNKKYRLKKHCLELVRFGRVFGIRVMMFKVEVPSEEEREYYENPFNLDAVKPGTYKGMVQVDPYWCNPVLDSQDGVQPDSLHFYDPTWWLINGKRVHRSHLIVHIPYEVADILKPSYMYGGIPLPQKIMERVYAAERTANELPLLATSKRQTVLKTDIAQAMMNKDSFVEVLQEWIQYRDNFQVKVCDKDAEDVVQLDTTLTDLDEVVMTSYQIVAAAANVPVTKLLGTSPKGFNATGEYEEASYHEELESIQEHDLTELVNRHHAMVCKSEGLNLDLAIEWNPLDSPTAEELANIRKTDADTDKALVETGAIDAYDVRARLIQDGESGYTWLEAVDRPGEIDLEPDPPQFNDNNEEPGSGQDAIEDSGLFLRAFLKGMEVEQEHAHTVDGDQVNVAAIVIDHLQEDLAYYSKIEKFGLDSDFKESDHPRDDDGKFANGGGSVGKKEKLKIEHWGPDDKYTSVGVLFIPKEGLDNVEFNIREDGQAVLYGDPIWLRAKDELSRTQLMRAVDNFLSPLGKNIFIRVSDNPDDYEHLNNGDHKGSKNHATGEKEYGLSVSKRPEYAAKYAYYVKGEKIADGSDGEPIIDPKTASVVGKRRTYKALYSDFERKQKKYAEKIGLTDEELKALRSSKTIVYD